MKEGRVASLQDLVYEWKLLPSRHVDLRPMSSRNIFFFFFGWNRTESTITEATTGLLYQPLMMIMMIVEQSVEWLAGETEILGKNLLQCHFSTTNTTWPDLGPHSGRRVGKPATYRLVYGTARSRNLLWYHRRWHLFRKEMKRWEWKLITICTQTKIIVFLRCGPV
jgi:hypothetical protein